MTFTVYLAGPDVFHPGALKIARHKKEICQKYGLTGIFPLDVDIKNSDSSPETMAQSIYQSNISLMNQANACIANMIPFRGAGMDPGTAFEIGYMTAQNKPVIGYTPYHESYKERVVKNDPESVFSDKNSLIIENFDLAENLMMAFGCFEVVRGEHSYLGENAPLNRTLYEDLTVFENACKILATKL